MPKKQPPAKREQLIEERLVRFNTIMAAKSNFQLGIQALQRAAIFVIVFVIFNQLFTNKHSSMVREEILAYYLLLFILFTIVSYPFLLIERKRARKRLEAMKHDKKTDK